MSVVTKPIVVVSNSCPKSGDRIGVVTGVLNGTLAIRARSGLLPRLTSTVELTECVLVRSSSSPSLFPSQSSPSSKQFNLTTQQLTQTMTLPSQRSSFTGVEYSFVSLFALGHHIITLVFHRPEQFKWIALISLAAVAVGTVSYAGWVWKRRGHLVHWEKIGTACKCGKVRL